MKRSIKRNFGRYIIIYGLSFWGIALALFIIIDQLTTTNIFHSPSMRNAPKHNTSLLKTTHKINILTPLSIEQNPIGSPKSNYVQGILWEKNNRQNQAKVSVKRPTERRDFHSKTEMVLPDLAPENAPALCAETFCTPRCTCPQPIQSCKCCAFCGSYDVVKLAGTRRCSAILSWYYRNDRTGEYGRPFRLKYKDLTYDERLQVDKGQKLHEFNEFISNKISVRRRLLDIRSKACKQAIYPDIIIDTSVIICFYNEAWSVLLRTVHSIVDRSPPHLIKEIILVDDFSSFDNLKKPLEEYMAMLGKVKILRNKKREGLIRSRLHGVSQATGHTLTFLDSHCECFPGWLEPLLYRVNKNRKAVIAPIIESTGEQNFQTSATVDTVTVGSLNFNQLEFIWGESYKMSGKDSTWPVRSATHAGGLFSIDKQFFEQLGGYDRGLKIWGSENLELSFKVWMCGGSLEISPCSHVGHIFRVHSPYSWGSSIEDITYNNKRRLAEIWLDEFSDIFLLNSGIYKYTNFGDVSEGQAIRKRNNCNSFRWYLENIAPDVYVPTMGKEFGEFWQLEKTGEISNGEHCLYGKKTKGTPFHLIIKKCSKYSRSQQNWRYQKDKTVYNVGLNLCLQAELLHRRVTLTACNGRRKRQQWVWNKPRSNAFQKQLESKKRSL